MSTFDEAEKVETKLMAAYSAASWWRGITIKKFKPLNEYQVVLLIAPDISPEDMALIPVSLDSIVVRTEKRGIVRALTTEKKQESGVCDTTNTATVIT